LPAKSIEPRVINSSEIVSVLSGANIIYLGEKHDRLTDRQAQLEIIQLLYQQDSQLAIALEMFQRPYQKFLDDYLAGKISEAELREKTEFDQRWGFAWESYAPIFRFAKAHKLPLIALNTPSEITRKVAKYGLESLTETEKQSIPPVSEIRTDNLEYRQLLLDIYQQKTHAGQGNSQNFKRFFTAQVLWDETMAETIANFYRINPTRKIIVIAGEFHIFYGYGIPSRVVRRLSEFSPRQRSILFSNPETFPLQKGRLPADFFFKFSDL
jgi:uncharacterized iron-regulated protein